MLGRATPTRPRHLRVREPRWGAGRASRGPTPRRPESVCLGLGAGPGPCVQPNLTVLSSAGPRRPHCPVEKPGPRRRPGRRGQLRRGLVSSLRRLCCPPHTPSSGCGNPPHWGPRASAAGSRHPQPLLLGPTRRPFWAPAGRTLVPLHRCFSPTAVTTSCGPCSEVAVAPWGSQVIR